MTTDSALQKVLGFGSKEFIEKAIGGGWSKTEFAAQHLNLRVENTELGAIDMPLDCVFLDPEAWKAVGKVEGWEYKLNGASQVRIEATDPEERKKIAEEWNIKPDWLVYMHRMIDALCENITP